MLILKFIMAIILTETITEVLVKSELLLPVRQYLFEKGKPVLTFLHNILDCGYCTSVWMGWLMALLFLNGLSVLHWSVDWFFLGLVLHRSSNALHNVMDKLGY